MRSDKTLEDFDWSFNPSINRQAVLALASCDYLRAHRNVLICGPTGVGKPHATNAIVGTTSAPVETITIIDPRHPLFGMTLPLVGFYTRTLQGRCCVLTLRPRNRGLVPLAATDRSP